MCVVSMVSDYYTKTWPQRFPDRPNPWVVPAPTPFPPPTTPHPQSNPLTPQEADELRKLMREALERLDKIDKKLGDVDCYDDAKRKFLEQMGLS